jgi:hypothetical protein
MPLGSTWWNNLGSTSRWTHDFTNNVMYKLNDNGMVRLHLNRLRMYQRTTTTGGTGSKQMTNPGFDSGYFSFSTSYTTNTEVEYSQAFSLIGDYNTYPPQCVTLYPEVEFGDIPPTTGVIGALSAGYYKTGFVDDLGGSGMVAGSPADAFVWFNIPANGVYYIWHYNPWAWFGTVPEVIAAACMQVGLDSDYIDTAAFDRAHDAFDASTGDEPWTDVNEDWEIYAYRTVGQKLSDFMFECARHARDFYYVSESGELSVNSFTSPNTTITSLGFSDGVIGVVDWEDTIEHMFNRVDATWGSATASSGDDSNAPNQTEYSCSFEPQLDSYTGSKWLKSATDSSSTSRYGEIPLKGKLTSINIEGQPKEVYKVHFPFLLSDHDTVASPSPGGMLHVTNWLSSDSQPRKIIQLKQDLRGLDFSVGDEVQDVELTSDGVTVGVTKCIRKKYDFRTMTVQSTLMEIPS